MATSTQITKSLTTGQMELLHVLDDEEIQLFKVSELRNLLKNKLDNYSELIENLTHKGFLLRLEKGKYCRSTFKDEYVMGTFMVESGAVGYWSALNLHGLTEQFSNTIYIQTPSQKKPKSILGTSYHFVQIKASKSGGITYNGYGNLRYAITDIEKTIVDCFDLPQYCGGYAELIRAFNSATLDADKLIAYCELNENQAATKRLGFLALCLKKLHLQPFIEYALSQVKTSYSLFDPQGANVGSFNNQWKLRLNITEEQILNIAQKHY